jgi:hypothetical protein
MRALTSLALLAGGGCVIPVAPEFDPPEKNYPPFVVTSNPGVGDIFTQGMSAEGREISAILSDFNLNDQLHIRWLVDYPGNETTTSKQIREVILPASPTPERTPVRIQPSCSIIGLAPGQHRLVMSVSDRRYRDALAGESVSPEAPLDSVPPDGNRIRVVWILNCL